jgi:hypothetical protein
MSPTGVSNHGIDSLAAVQACRRGRAVRQADDPPLRVDLHDPRGEGVAKETARSLAGESGFPWIPFPRLELHIYNIRHIQHHAGQLGAFLRRNKVKGVGWVGTHAL